MQLHILRRKRAVETFGQKADLPACLQNGCFNFVRVKVPGYPGLTQKLIYINSGPLQGCF